MLTVGIHRNHACEIVPHRVANPGLHGTPSPLRQRRTKHHGTRVARDGARVIAARIVDNEHIKVACRTNFGDHGGNGRSLVFGWDHNERARVRFRLRRIG